MTGNAVSSPRGHRVRSLTDLLAKARSAGRRTVLVCAVANDVASLESIDLAIRQGLVEPILIGDADRIRSVSAVNGIPLHSAEIRHEPDPQRACEQAVALCRSGYAGVLMKGGVPTAQLLKSVLDRANGLASSPVLSHVAVFRARGASKLLLLSDAGVNIAPDMRCQLEIIRNAIRVAQLLGIVRPRVALLAAVEKSNVKMPATVMAADLAREFACASPETAWVQGPYSLDLAVSPEAARAKGVQGEVAGRSDILIAPDIEAANILYKSLVCFAKLDIASVVTGASVPIAVPSRSDSSRSKLVSIALAVHLANSGGGSNQL